MAESLVYVDVSHIREGKLGELEAAMNHLSQFVETNMPRVLSYGFFLDESRTTMTVVAVHPDSASLEFHLDKGNEEFRKFAHLIELARIDVYGNVTDGVLDRLHRKVAMLGKRRRHRPRPLSRVHAVVPLARARSRPARSRNVKREAHSSTEPFGLRIRFIVGDHRIDEGLELGASSRVFP